MTMICVSRISLCYAFMSLHTHAAVITVNKRAHLNLLLCTGFIELSIAVVTSHNRVTHSSNKRFRHGVEPERLFPVVS